jgi:hypothetical protein
MELALEGVEVGRKRGWLSGEVTQAGLGVWVGSKGNICIMNQRETRRSESRRRLLQAYCRSEVRAVWQ